MSMPGAEKSSDLELPLNVPGMGGMAVSRRRLLLSLLPLMGALTLATLPAYEIAGAPPVGYAIGGGCTAGFWILALLLWRRRLDLEAVALASMLLAGGLLLFSVGISFAAGVQPEAVRNFPIVSPIISVLYFLLVYRVLPYPRSLYVALGNWLGMAAVVTIGAYPSWISASGRLTGVRLLVWPGHLGVVLVMAAEARSRSRLFTRYVRATGREARVRAALAQSEIRLRAVFDRASVGIAVLDISGRWLLMNDKVAEITGYSLDELQKIDFQNITHPDDLAADVELAQQVIRGEIAGYQLEKRYIRKDGRIVWVLLHVGRIEATARRPAQFVSVIEDISDRKQREAHIQALTSNLEAQVASRTEQLRRLVDLGERRNAQLRLATEMTGLLPAATQPAEIAGILSHYMPRLFPRVSGAVFFRDADSGRYAGMALWGSHAQFDLEHGADGCEALRSGQECRIENPLDPLCCGHWSPAHRGMPHTCVPLLALGESVGLLELAWRDPSGEHSPEPILLRTLCEQLGLTLANLRLREELRRQALHDPLTGLYNRRHLDEVLRARMAEQQRSGQGFAVLMIDIDHFKRINDRWGHGTGDSALCRTAGLLRRAARGDESAFRYGGEEFLLVIRCGEPAEALQCAERIRREVAALHRQSEPPLPPLSVSVGVACFPQDAADAPLLLRQADEAVYLAKAAGRNCVRRIGPGAG